VKSAQSGWPDWIKNEASLKKYAGQAATAILVLLSVWYVLNHANEMTAAARAFIQWVDRSGMWGVLIFGGLVSFTVVFLLPGVFLSIGAGFLYGTSVGTAVFMAGEMLGAILAFGLAHRFLKARVLGYFQGHPKLGFLNDSLADEGWTFIALTRLTPFFPFKLSNYMFGALAFRFSDFFWGTLLGSLPLCLTLVYLGSLLPDLTGLESQTPWSSTLGRMTALGTGAVAVLGLTWISVRARRSFQLKLADWEMSR
jgi:uncharacterized membrane protein YdjX (TVP38/TMEM64 family)